MKSKLVIFVASILIFAGCKKEEGPGGKNSIGGHVYFKNGVTGKEEPAPNAVLYLDYGNNGNKESFDQKIISNSDGTYKFSNLRKGDYFLKASYIDEHGFEYTGIAYELSLKHRKKHTEIAFVLE